MKEELFIIGYPRSGNVWISRLLGRILDSEIASGKPKPSIADEGSKRSGKYIIRQLHSRKPVNGKVVFMYRDPRDIAVSAMHYWQYKSLMDMFTSNRKAIRVLGNDTVGGWHSFMDLWIGDNGYGVNAIVSYEGLHKNAQSELSDAIENLDEIVDEQKIADAVEAEQFAKRKSHINQSAPDAYPYGRDIQLRHMRKGVVGDWRNYFDRKTAEMVNEKWWYWLEKLEYEIDPDWWKGLPE